ncbi:MAG: hypothetical protein E7095_02080 [Bacteroides sp.]|nr:hypothetical protein [Bacteroides sp.]
MAQLQLVYKQAAALMPTVQHTFEEMVSYHNKMLANLRLHHLGISSDAYATVLGFKVKFAGEEV